MFNAIAKFLDKPDLGFLIIRIVAGAIFVAAGVGKLLGGKAALVGTGEAMGLFGIGFAPMLWGLLAALVETVGGALMIIGFLFRGAAFFLAGTMVVASVVKLDEHGFNIVAIGYPLALLAVSVGLMLTGPGKLAIQKGSAAS